MQTTKSKCDCGKVVWVDHGVSTTRTDGKRIYHPNETKDSWSLVRCDGCGDVVSEHVPGAEHAKGGADSCGGFTARARQWVKENQDWELICDIEDTEQLYIQWNELSKNERMYWVGSHKGDPRGAFEEFGTKQCKVERKFLDNNLNICDKWPPGNATTIYKTSIEGKRIIK